jgi:aminoglycoside phosphotransferase
VIRHLDNPDGLDVAAGGTSERVAEEVAAALERAGFRGWRARRISAVQVPGRRRLTYRIDLPSGETIKARLVEDEATAQRLFALRRDLPTAFVPAFAHLGAVLLERWVPGDVVRGQHLTQALVEQAATLLGELHATPSVLGETLPTAQPTASWRERTAADLAGIVAAGEIDRSQAAALLATLDHADPGTSMGGLVHTDFCGENMVVDDRGSLHVVDNERIGIDSLSYDFARSWYRWALPARLWASFREVYGTCTASAEQVETLPFWSIVAVVQSAALRLRADRAWARAALDRLRGMKS